MTLRGPPQVDVLEGWRRHSDDDDDVEMLD